jgi:hypothetical protein
MKGDMVAEEYIAVSRSDGGGTVLSSEEMVFDLFINKSDD